MEHIYLQILELEAELEAGSQSGDLLFCSEVKRLISEAVQAFRDIYEALGLDDPSVDYDQIPF